jgi:hypothetical protein
MEIVESFQEHMRIRRALTLERGQGERPSHVEGVTNTEKQEGDHTQV